MDQSSDDMLSLIQASLDHMDEGIAIFDKDLRLVRLNKSFAHRFGFPEGLMTAGVSVKDLIAFNAERGIYGEGDPKTITEERFRHFAERTRNSYARVMPDGSFIEADWYPLPKGGMVLVYRDITKQRQVEDTLRRQAEIIQGIHEAVCVFDENELFTGWNRAAEKLWGYKREEVLGKHRELILARDEEFTPVAEIRKQLAAHGHLEVKRCFEKKNGEEFIGLVSFSLLEDSGDHPERLIGFVRDISQQMKAEAEAQSSQKRFQAFMEHSPAIAFIKDSEGRHVFANRTFEQSLEPEGTGWLGKTDFELWDTETAIRLQKNDAKVLASGEPLVAEENIVTEEGVRTYLVSKFPIEGESGEKMIGGLALDLTDFKNTEKALLESEARLRGVHENAADGIFTIDEQGTIETTNQAAEEMFGYGRRELIGKNVASLMTGDHKAHHQSYIDNYTESGVGQILGVGPRELIGIRKDGSELAMDLAVNVMNLDDRRIFVGVVRDITDRKETRQQLQQAQKMEAVGQLTGGIAHDFNNMLAIVLGNLELAIERSEQGKDVSKLLHLAVEGATRGADLTKHLLAFSRQQFLAPRVVDINETIGEMSDILKRTIGEGVEVEFALDQDLWRSKIDPVQLQSAVLNLAINGRDAMQEGGQKNRRLRIITSNVKLAEGTKVSQQGLEAGEYVVVSVSDNGVGINPEILAHIFEPFFATKDVGKGSGLGLSMVYGFAQQSGGIVVVESEPGVGTEFTIYLPRKRGRKKTTPAILEHKKTGAKGHSVLLVEDDGDVRELVAQYLSGMGLRVLEAKDGESVRSILQDNPEISPLLTDMVLLGGLGGLKISRLVRRAIPGVKVLYMSGYAAHSTLQGDRVEESARLIQKPFRRRDLENVITDIFSL